MKKKGFTLIELLAVIIVLAVIALIVTPIVTKTIKNAKKGSAEIAAQNYIRAVELAISNSELNRNPIPDGTYTIDSDGNLIGTGLPNGKLEIDASGDRPTGGTITIKDGQVTKDSVITVGDYDVSYDEDNKKYEATENGIRKYANGEVVYFNVTTGEKCTSSDYTETQSNTGVNSGCMKFYAFNDKGGKTVNLILDHNTTAVIAWNSSSSNASGPLTLLKQLKSDTSSWKGTETPENYTNAKYTIDYSSYKARLITAQEIATITGNTSWDEKNATGIYICKSGDTTSCMYGWLYDRTSTDCTTHGCLNNSDKEIYGYWTAFSDDKSSSGDVWSVAWYVGYDGVSSTNLEYGDGYGVRPVIEVLKSKLS